MCGRVSVCSRRPPAAPLPYCRGGATSSNMPRRRRHKKGTQQSEPPPSPAPSPANDSPYIVQQSDIMGRFLVARRDLPEGTVLIAEEPLVVGPAQDCPPVCLGCYTPSPSHSCPGCGWPLCSARCGGLHQALGHSQGECRLLEQCRPTCPRLARHLLYNTVVPLRCLLLRDSQPALWTTLLTMEAHNAERRRRPDIWDHNQSTVVDRIRKDWNITAYSEDEIHTVCGILEVNAFAVGEDSLNIRALYPTAFLLAHSCVPNTAHTDDDQFRLTLFSSVPIECGQTITLSYTNSLHGTKKRREHLKQCKFFDCACERCADRTELGTYLSGVRCEQCGEGTLLPSVPLDPSAPWTCNAKHCQAHLAAADIDHLVQRIDNELKVAHQSDVVAMESCLRKYSIALHRNHYLLLGLRYSLTQLYGKSEGFLIHQLSTASLERKAQLCEEVLQVFNVLEPGLSRIRGLTLYELHAPLMVLTIQLFETSKISKADLSRRLRRVAGYLQEAIKVLKYESGTSPEGLVRAAAQDALSQLKTWEPIVGKL